VAVAAVWAIAVGLAAPVHATPVHPLSKCDLPTTRDLIIWQRAPQLLDSATEIGDANLLQCKPTLATWASEQPTGPGYCTKIAWVDDNPGYDVDAKPAPTPKKVIEAVGDC
jgi:hypothetical protein